MFNYSDNVVLNDRKTTEQNIQKGHGRKRRHLPVGLEEKYREHTRVSPLVMDIPNTKQDWYPLNYNI
jgi:hypothetical protein